MAITALSLLILFFLPLSSSATLPLSSAAAAAGILRSRGYSLMARVLDLTAASGGTLNGWNATGTLFAPTDPAFKKPDRRRLHRGLPWLPTSRPPVSFLLYHTARTRPLLYADLASRPAGTPIPTFSRRRLCLFLRHAPGGEPCLAESARPAEPCVRIRDPDLYRDGDIAVHGVDGVLDPTAASPCQVDTWHDSAPFDARVRVRKLRQKGYAAVAEAMEARAELGKLTAITVFAPMDSALANGFRYHAVPRDLERPSLGSRIQPMARGATIAIGSNGGAATVNGVVVDGEEIHRDDWAVVLPTHRPLRFEDSGALNDSVCGAPISPSAFGSEVYSTSIGFEPATSPDSVASDGNVGLPDGSPGEDSVNVGGAVLVPSGGVQELVDGEEVACATRGGNLDEVKPDEQCSPPGMRHVARKYTRVGSGRGLLL